MEQNKPRGTREKNFMLLAKGYDVGITETIIILHEELPKKKKQNAISTELLKSVESWLDD
jgi:hypothetical protein